MMHNFFFFFMLIVLDLNVPTLSVSPNATVNEDDSVVLSCNVAGSEKIVYQWFKNEVSFPGSSKFYIINSIQRNDIGEYRCSATNSYATTNSDTITINVNCKYF